MTTLRKFLTNQGYKKIKLTLTKTNHFEASAILNTVQGNFIIDTGASNSCVGFEASKKFGLCIQESEIKASGAGATDMFTQLSKNNSLDLGKWSFKKVSLVLFDLSHVNQALTAHNAAPVDGIIGADVLKKGKAIIDYANKAMYLK
ncbi:retropepsin-like aspartic protease [Aquimarina sp. W85]|uniref:retropepsin-like aspartic protease n=1 Tax=Aquimarina rhodophyticola TaxID=3342246 RepID=UPI00366EEC8E